MISLENQNWTFVPGNPQLQRRPGVEGRYLDAMPGGMGFLIKIHIPHVRTALLLNEYTEEEKRRVVSITNSTRRRIGTCYVCFRFMDMRRAGDDPDRMQLNEQLLHEVFREADACGRLPVIILQH